MDRCKHIFKLSQGEFVAPERIESVYLESRFVTQIFVDGDSEQTYPVAIVVPEPETLVNYINSKPTVSAALNGNAPSERGNQKIAAGDTTTPSGEHPTTNSGAPKTSAAPPAVDPSATYVVHGSQMTLAQLCDYKPAIKIVLEDLTALGKARGLKGFEQVFWGQYILNSIFKTVNLRHLGTKMNRFCDPLSSTTLKS